MSTPKPDGYRLDELWRIRARIETLHRIPKSRNRYLEKDLEVTFRDGFMVLAIAKDPYASTHFHEATGMPFPTLYKWRDHLELDATWRSWNHNVNHGSHNCKLNDFEEKLIEEALSERRAPREDR
jgi:hypothetical protein